MCGQREPTAAQRKLLEAARAVVRNYLVGQLTVGDFKELRRAVQACEAENELKKEFDGETSQ